MGLLDLQTDLTSLKYGAKLPAVRHKMGNKVSQASARIDDVKRLGVILTQAPGLKFTSNQTLLQNAKIGSAIASKDKLGGAVLAGIGAAFKATVGSGIFLTANAGRAGTGFHGINPSVASSYLTSTVPSQPGEEAVRPGSEGQDKESFLTRVINTVSAIATAIGAKSSNYHAAQEILGGAQFVSKTYKDPLYLSVGKDQGTSKIYVDNSGGVKKAIRRTDLYDKLEVGQVDNEKRYLNSDDLKDKRFDKYYRS